MINNAIKWSIMPYFLIKPYHLKIRGIIHNTGSIAAATCEYRLQGIKYHINCFIDGTPLTFAKIVTALL
jgi:hypothetical protein